MICYIILRFSVVGDRNNVISPSEIYHGIQKKKEIRFLETNDIKGTTDQFYIYTYLTLTLFMRFNIT